MLSPEDETGREGITLVVEEKLLFVMPDSLEELLFASVVLSQYLISRMVIDRAVKDVVVVCKNEELHDYLRACWVWAKVVVEPTESQLVESDFVFEFNAESSYRVTQAVRKHVAEAFAIQLGVGLMRFLPPVLVEDRTEDIGTVLVAERNRMDGVDESWIWPYREEFVAMLEQKGVPVIFLDCEAGWEEIKDMVGKASVVVGVRSSVTTVAAAANRLVMELSPDSKGHRDWFRKKECATWKMIYGSLSSMSSSFVWEQVEKLVSSKKDKKAAPVLLEA